MSGRHTMITHERVLCRHVGVPALLPSAGCLHLCARARIRARSCSAPDPAPDPDPALFSEPEPAFMPVVFVGSHAP